MTIPALSGMISVKGATSMMSYKCASNMVLMEGAADRLRQILASLPEKETGKINHLLEPEYLSMDETTFVSEVLFRRKEWEENLRGEIHGGIIATMFDLTTGWTAAAVLDDYGMTTADIQVSYIKPFYGDSFLFRSELVYAGNRNVRMRGVATDPETQKTLAICTATFARIS